MSQFRDVDFKGGFGLTLTACLVSAVYSCLDFWRRLAEGLQSIPREYRNSIHHARKLCMQNSGADVAVHDHKMSLSSVNSVKTRAIECVGTMLRNRLTYL